MRFIVWLLIAPIALLAGILWMPVHVCSVVYFIYSKGGDFDEPDWILPWAPGFWLYALLDRAWPLKITETPKDAVEVSMSEPATLADLYEVELRWEDARRRRIEEPTQKEDEVTTAIYISESLVKNARKFATDAHAGQFRRDGVTPYISHPEGVAELVDEPAAKAVAWLHDVIEDCDVTEASLRLLFPGNVVDAVVLLTKVDVKDHLTYIRQIKVNHLACTVKIADMRHNLSCDPTYTQRLRYTTALSILLDYPEIVSTTTDQKKEV